MLDFIRYVFASQSPSNSQDFKIKIRINTIDTTGDSVTRDTVSLRMHVCVPSLPLRSPAASAARAHAIAPVAKVLFFVFGGWDFFSPFSV